MRKLLYTLGCIALFFSCKNEKAAPSVSIPTKTEIETPKPSTAPQYYLHLKGTIQNLPVTMNLNYHKLANTGNSDAKAFYQGSYYYDKYQEPIELHQTKDSSGVLILTEKYAYDEDNRFVGKLEGNTFSGKWFDGYRQFSFPFKLTVVGEDEAINFDYRSFSETYKLFPDKEKSPLAQFGLSALWPQDYKNPDATAFLKKSIMGILTDDSLAQNAVTPEDYFNQAKEKYFDNYRKDLEDVQVDGGFSSYNYGADTDLFIVWNAEDLLSIGATYYENTGGAHPNSGTIYHVLDVKNEKILTEEDVFKPNFEAIITKALLASAERTFDSDMNDYTPIDAISKKKLKPNGNFFVTGGGVGYNFVPYEIGSYAIGEIQLFLPKEEIRGVLTNEFLARMGW